MEGGGEGILPSSAYPTAQTSLLLIAATPVSRLSAAAVLGLVVWLQAVPSQCRVRVCCVTPV